MQKSTAVDKQINQLLNEYTKIICLAVISFYRNFISPLKPHVCRFYPSCSQYTFEAVNKYGILKGMGMGLKRILKCHPLNPGGYDPVN